MFKKDQASFYRFYGQGFIFYIIVQIDSYVYHSTTDHIKEKDCTNQQAKNNAQTPGYYQKMVDNDLVEVKSWKCFGNA